MQKYLTINPLNKIIKVSYLLSFLSIFILASCSSTEEELDEMNIKSPDDEIAESSPEDAS